MVDLVKHQVLSLAPVRLLKRRETTYVKRLQEMRRVRRHTESNNLVLLAVLLEFEGVVALVAINNEQTIASHGPPLCVRIKVL